MWLDRPINLILWERILGQGLRTADPEEADYFFIPGCGRGCNLWDQTFELITVSVCSTDGGRCTHAPMPGGVWGQGQQLAEGARAPRHAIPHMSYARPM